MRSLPTPTFFVDMPRRRQVWEAGGAAVLAGLVTGVLDEVDARVRLIAVIVSVIGGLPSGTQHRTWRGASARAIADGGLWGAAVLVVIASSSRPPVDDLASPPAAFLAASIVGQLALTLAVWFCTARRRSV